MFQPPVVETPEKLCELMKGAGYDGIQWTVRKGGHVEPADAAANLPRLVKIAESFGLKSRSICTDITADAAGKPGLTPGAETVLKVAADCGIEMFRPAYFFYDAKTETFSQSLDRIRGGFAALARLAARTGVKATYQNHSSWGPSVFGGLVWDVYECIRDLLKDFHYQSDPKNPKKMKKQMVAAGEGVVPWAETRKLLDANGVKPLYVLHFEYDFDKTDLKKTVATELAGFKRVFA